LDRHSIISVALMVIIALVALNYFDVECNIGQESKPITQEAPKKAENVRQATGDVPQAVSEDPTTPTPGGEGGDDAPSPGTPFVPPSPGSPGP
jgi:hypothetical protein